MAVPASRLGYFILVDLVFITHGFADWNLHEIMSSRPFVTRRLSNGQERMDLVCPDNHVMLTPYIAYGASIGRRVSNLRLERDCLGTDSQLIKQANQCVRKNACSVSFRKGLRLHQILSGPQNKCLKRFPKFITISLPKCVPKEEIFDICSNWTLGKYWSGILGRYSDIPNTDMAARSCHKVMTFPTNMTMAIMLEKFDTNISYNVTIQWTTQHGETKLKTLRFNHESFIGTGNNFTVSWETPEQVASKSNFYLIYHALHYNGSSNQSDTMVQSWIPELPSASLRSVMTWKDHQLSFACPKGSLLYSPQLMAGVGKRMACSGITPSLLVQMNNCYWERSCNINWKGPATVTLTNSPACLGKTAAVMSTTGYRCIRQENVINMCSRYASEVVKKTSGIIRSHNIYPWDYGAEAVDCRKVIKIGRGRQLHLSVEAAEIDESRDMFRIRHIYDKKKTLVAMGNQKHFNTTLSGGAAEISLTVSVRSKTGKGFLLYFEKIGKRHKNSESQYRKARTTKKNRTLRNRRRRQRSGRKKNKKRKSRKSKKRKTRVL
ncbi:uncharacterized protein LOC117321802 [Pecten maximus]|uniref:uncharacterized protein LOC117321802 n=1 Tax=Pecten maximus TaxID=6579 RepID=UPI0014585A0B|nr:uncharacterized protein LOC117321802 [Pecten maximus]